MFKVLLKILGAIFTVLVLIVCGFFSYVWYLDYAGDRNERKAKEFARESILAISETWDVRELLKRYNPRHKAKIDNVALERAFELPRKSGSRQNLSELEGALGLRKSIGAGLESTAIYTGTVISEHGIYVMRLDLSKWDGDWFIDQFDVCDKTTPVRLTRCYTGREFIIPATSSLQFSHFEKRSTQNYFQGNTTLSGTLVFRAAETGSGYYTLFIPDSRSSAMLPYEKTRGPVKELIIRDEINMLEKLLPEKTKKQLLRPDKISSVEIASTITVTDYMTTTECDHLLYIARAIEVVSTRDSPKLTQVRASSDGCG